MCGIVGYVGARDATPIIYEGLKRLEYRGYDSAGLAVIQNGQIEIRRDVGKLDRLGEIRCPTLVVGAERDYFSIGDKETYTSMIPNAQLKIVEDALHDLPAEKPEEFNQIVLDFLLGLS